MSVSIVQNSRLGLCDLAVIDEYEFWDMLDLPMYTQKADDFFHLVSKTDRMDLLAHSFYGDPNLWWVIAWANDLEILPTQLIEGASIRIPSVDFVKTKLFSGQMR